MTSTETRKKKARISSAVLAKVEVQSKLRAGTLYKLAWKNSPDQIVQGEVRNACLEGIVIDFRHGREEGRVPAYSFITLADATGMCSIGAHTVTSGLDKFRIPSENLTDTSRCYFEAKISGNFNWNPNRKDPTKPVIIARGTFQKLSSDVSPISKFMGLCCPTFDVLDQISKHEYAETSRYTTSAVLGEITSTAVVSSSNTVKMCMEDLVGMAIVQISEVTDADLFMKENKLGEGKVIMIRGPLCISAITIQGEAYPYLSISETDVNISEISREQKNSYEKLLMEEGDNAFVGVIPYEN